MPVSAPGVRRHGNTAALGELLRDAIAANPNNLRVFGPDETASNRLQAIYERSKKVWMEELRPEDGDATAVSWPGRGASWRCSANTPWWGCSRAIS